MSNPFQNSVTSLGNIAQLEDVPNLMQESKKLCVSSMINPQPQLIKSCKDFSAQSIPRLNCHLHPGYTFTNFCKGETCFFPLCPECVTLHVNEHIEHQSKPKLDSLENILNTVQQVMLQQTNQLASDFFKLNNAVIQAKSINDGVIFKIKEIKDRIIKIIDQHFNALLNEVENKQSKNMENYKRDASSFQQVIQERWTTHYEFMQHLTKSDCMRYVVPFFKSKVLEENKLYFSLAEDFSQRFSTHQSQIQFDQIQSSQLGNYIGTFLKIANYDLPEFLDFHKLAPADFTQMRTKIASRVNSNVQSEQKISSGSKKNMEITKQLYQNEPSFQNIPNQQKQSQKYQIQQSIHNQDEYQSIRGFGSRKQ